LINHLSPYIRHDAACHEMVAIFLCFAVRCEWIEDSKSTQSRFKSPFFRFSKVVSHFKVRGPSLEPRFGETVYGVVRLLHYRATNPRKWNSCPASFLDGRYSGRK